MANLHHNILLVAHLLETTSGGTGGWVLSRIQKDEWIQEVSKNKTYDWLVLEISFGSLSHELEAIRWPLGICHSSSFAWPDPAFLAPLFYPDLAGFVQVWPVPAFGALPAFGTGLFRTSRQFNEWTSWGLVNRNKTYLSCRLWCQNTFVACKVCDKPHFLWMWTKDGWVAKSWHCRSSGVLRYISTYCISSVGVGKWI